MRTFNINFIGGIPHTGSERANWSAQLGYLVARTGASPLKDKSQQVEELGGYYYKEMKPTVERGCREKKKNPLWSLSFQ